MNRQRRKSGDIVKVPIDSNWHTYARVLNEPLIAFYDARTNRDLSPEEIVTRPILFTLWVMNRAITSGRWKRVAHISPDPALLKEPAFFKQDTLNPLSYSIYRAGQEIQATKEECRGLERAAVWDAEHVEDRLRDHYLGQPNKWVESLKLQIPSSDLDSHSS